MKTFKLMREKVGNLEVVLEEICWINANPVFSEFVVRMTYPMKQGGEGMSCISFVFPTDKITEAKLRFKMLIASMSTL